MKKLTERDVRISMIAYKIAVSDCAFGIEKNFDLPGVFLEFLNRVEQAIEQEMGK